MMRKRPILLGLLGQTQKPEVSQDPKPKVSPEQTILLKPRVLPKALNVKYVYFHYIWLGNQMKCNCQKDVGIEIYIKHCIFNIVETYNTYLPQCKKEGQSFKIIIHTDVPTFQSDFNTCVNNLEYEHIIIKEINVKEILDKYLYENIKLYDENKYNIDIKMSDFILNALYGEKKIYMATSDILRMLIIGNFSFPEIQYNDDEYILNLYIDTDEIIKTTISKLYFLPKFFFWRSIPDRRPGIIKTNNDVLGFLYLPEINMISNGIEKLSFELFRNAYIKQIYLGTEKFVNDTCYTANGYIYLAKSIINYTGIETYARMSDSLIMVDMSDIPIESKNDSVTGNELSVQFKKEYANFLHQYILSISAPTHQDGGIYYKKFIKYQKKMML
jgi:hypothetical protein